MANDVAAYKCMVPVDLANATPAAGTPQKEQPSATSETLNSDIALLKEMLTKPLCLLILGTPFAFFSRWGCMASFSFSFLAIIPLASILGDATESCSHHFGDAVGGLLNATFGNAVEMILSLSAIKKGYLKVVQDNLVGSVLSNLLLVLGMAFVGAGMLRLEDVFNKEAAGVNSSLLLLASIGMVLPTLFSNMDGTSQIDMLDISRICACVLATVYGFFMLFQLKTHVHHFRTSQADEPIPEEEDEGPFFSVGTASCIMAATTLLITFLSEVLIGSIDPVCEQYGVPRTFIGLVLLPIVGNAAEHLTAVMGALRGKMDLAMAVAVGSSTQVALFIVPFSVLIGWWYEQPMSLDFGVFGSCVIILAVFLVGHVSGDGAANWLEGVMLLATYFMIASICWYIPDDDFAGKL
eukprot:TRINITY_DN21074_c0_g1_i1.p1 TRINITY_DN21074_c0_g1~~TRINITY_DN21074_c0_g1_i1.p1  ORF type:complete len:436 (+),score=79.84 TRINITY_DN21074_c0_g1_i1:83-1309(+)